MARTGGDKTRKRILKVAETLFAANGFDATGVDQIAKTAAVNKALIYYHFKNKEDLIVQLLKNVVSEVAEYVEEARPRSNDSEESPHKRALRDEIEFMKHRKGILAVMLSEALRSNDRENYLFRCAELVVQSEHGPLTNDDETTTEARRRMLHEFFTGFIPLVSFAVLHEKWSTYFGGSEKDILEDFLNIFMESHSVEKNDCGG